MGGERKTEVLFFRETFVMIYRQALFFRHYFGCLGNLTT